MIKSGIRVLSIAGTGHCICALDYDNIKDFSNLKDEIKHLQKQYDLGTFYIMRTKKNHYSAICFSIVSHDELSDIMEDADLVDLKQKNAFITLKRIGFRVTQKNKRGPGLPFDRIKNKTKRQKSDSHLQFFAGFYPCSFFDEKIGKNYMDLFFEEFTKSNFFSKSGENYVK